MSVDALKFINDNAFSFVFMTFAAVFFARMLFGQKGFDLDDLPTRFHLTVEHHHHFYPYEEQSPFEEDEGGEEQEIAA